MSGYKKFGNCATGIYAVKKLRSAKQAIPSTLEAICASSPKNLATVGESTLFSMYHGSAPVLVPDFEEQYCATNGLLKLADLEPDK
jgi:hypothetical protein